MLNIFKSPKKHQDVNNESSLLVKQFNGLNIQVYGTYEEPLFKAKDIGDLLDIKKIRTTLDNLDESCKVLKDAHTMGGLQQQLFLTEDGLYELLFISRKPIAKQFKIWIRNIIKEIRLKGKYDLEEKLKLKDFETQKILEEHQQQLEAKEQELLRYKEKTYDEIEKTGHIYVIKTDGGTKVGKTKDAVNKRIRGLQTGNVNNIEILLNFKTSNPDLLEKCAHYILDRYRCNSNREFFDCDINYIKTIVEICGNVINTLKSTYQHISKGELVEKLKNNGIEIEVEETNVNECDSDEQENNDLYNWLEDNIECKRDTLLQVKDVVQLYTNKSKVHSSLSSKFKKEIEKYIKEKYKHIKWEYDAVKIGDKTCKGWKNISIKDN
jgi:prophage antirepressor-like protein